MLFFGQREHQSESRWKQAAPSSRESFPLATIPHLARDIESLRSRLVDASLFLEVDRALLNPRLLCMAADERRAPTAMVEFEIGPEGATEPFTVHKGKQGPTVSGIIVTRNRVCLRIFSRTRRCLQQLIH